MTSCGLHPLRKFGSNPKVLERHISAVTQNVTGFTNRINPVAEITDAEITISVK